MVALWYHDAFFDSEISAATKYSLAWMQVIIIHDHLSCDGGKKHLHTRFEPPEHSNHHSCSYESIVHRAVCSWYKIQYSKWMNTSLRGSLFDMGLATVQHVEWTMPPTIPSSSLPFSGLFGLLRNCWVIPSLRNWSHYSTDSVSNSQIIHSFLIKYK